MKNILKVSNKNDKNIEVKWSKITKEQVLVNNMHVNVFVCIINNPGINALKISRKTKIPQATVYRSLFHLIETGFLDTMNRKPGRNGGNSTIMYASKAKRVQIIIDSKGVHVY